MESTLLKKVLGEPPILRIIGILVEYVDDDGDDGEIFQCYFHDDGTGQVRIEHWGDEAIKALEKFGHYAEPFTDDKEAGEM